MTNEMPIQHLPAGRELIAVKQSASGQAVSRAAGQFASA
jgi:hypothetical protein